MVTMHKSFALAIIIFILVVSSMIIIKLSFASIPKPSVPEFTVKDVASSYSVTTTDPYTGLDVTKQHSNNTIQVTIENQPLSDSTHHIYYNIRTRPHFGGNWTELYPVYDQPNAPYNWDTKTWTYSKYLVYPNTPKQSNTDYTVITISLGENSNYPFGRSE